MHFLRKILIGKHVSLRVVHFQRVVSLRERRGNGEVTATGLIPSYTDKCIHF
ncbi:hypothetical protein Plhal304r1_c025g0085051 [Plasmopara halstedii]